MGIYKQKYNAVSGQLNLVPSSTIVTFKAAVANEAALPLIGNILYDGRITNDNGHLWIWDDVSWLDQGDIIDLKWAAIEDKPISSVANIDDAVSKKHSNSLDHAQGTDQKLDDGGVNEVTVADVKDAVDKKHTQGTDQGLDTGGANAVVVADIKDAVTKKHVQNSDTILNSGGANHVTASELVKNILNVSLLAFSLAIETSRNFLNLVDGIVDNYEDESGIDVVSCINQTYVPTSDCYSTESLIDSETKALCHFDGTDEDVDTVDSSQSNHTFTFHDNAKIDSEKQKFGATSLKLGASSNVQILGTLSDWQFDTDDFTIEFFINHWGLWGYGYNSYLLTNNFQISRANAGLSFYDLLHGNAGCTAPSDVLTLNTWHHVAFCMLSGVLSVYVDGIDVTASRTGTVDISSSTSMQLGQFTGDQNYGSVNGWMDELRISKGVCRYTTNFTPPTSQFQAEVKNMTLISEAFDADIAPDLARITILEEDLDAVTLNTDLLAYASRDDGTTWTQGTLSKENDFDLNIQTLVTSVDVSGQPSGTKIRYKYETDNTKNLKIHASSLLWD